MRFVVALAVLSACATPPAPAPLPAPVVRAVDAGAPPTPPLVPVVTRAPYIHPPPDVMTPRISPIGDARTFWGVLQRNTPGATVDRNELFRLEADGATRLVAYLPSTWSSVGPVLTLRDGGVAIGFQGPGQVGVARVNADGTPRWSTVLATTYEGFAHAIDEDESGELLVSLSGRPPFVVGPHVHFKSGYIEAAIARVNGATGALEGAMTPASGANFQFMNVHRLADHTFVTLATSATPLTVGKATYPGATGALIHFDASGHPLKSVRTCIPWEHVRLTTGELVVRCINHGGLEVHAPTLELMTTVNLASADDDGLVITEADRAYVWVNDVAHRLLSLRQVDPTGAMSTLVELSTGERYVLRSPYLGLGGARAANGVFTAQVLIDEPRADVAGPLFGAVRLEPSPSKQALVPALVAGASPSPLSSFLRDDPLLALGRWRTAFLDRTRWQCGIELRDEHYDPATKETVTRVADVDFDKQSVPQRVSLHFDTRSGSRPDPLADNPCIQQVAHSLPFPALSGPRQTFRFDAMP